MVPGRPSDWHFYPRPPRGGRPFKVSERCCYYLFLSTSPARGTTFASAPLHQVFYVSIHVPREGDDQECVDLLRLILISIHVPREGDDAVRL